MDYFLDPVLRGPMWGTIFLCLTLSLVGVFVYFQKKSLLGEVLSHAAYPGVILGLMFLGSASLTAFIFCVLALFLIRALMKIVSQDLSLTFTLSTFFGFGILLLSILQFSHGALGRLAETYFFGQAATMGDREVYQYALLALFAIVAIFLFYRELKVLLFDPLFAQTIGVSTTLLTWMLLAFTLVALVSGIRSVGVVLISAMLVAPTLAARFWVKRFSALLFLTPILGILSAILGNIFSYEISRHFSTEGSRLVIPTGPAIVLVASILALLSIFFSPSRGIVSQALRLKKYQDRKNCENLLKYLYRHPDATNANLQTLFSRRGVGALLKQHLIAPTQHGYVLTEAGTTRALEIIRLHRLWEVYLVQFMGKGEGEVHEAAEEMEHVLTPEMEEKLTKILNDPKFDPHQQPIPPKRSAS